MFAEETSVFRCTQLKYFYDQSFEIRDIDNLSICIKFYFLIILTMFDRIIAGQIGMAS